MNQIIKHKDKYYLRTETGYREIISSTDETLGLPKPSNSFISKYIEEYNKGNQITDVLVEYERVQIENLEEYKWIEEKVTSLSTFELKLKIDSNNTITIKKVKDSYSREEVEKLVTKALKTKVVWQSEVDNWIKENL